MENSLKGLILAAGTIITCVVISLAFFISREAKQTATNGAQEINKINTEFAESDKVVYDNTTVSGSEVVNVIKKMKEESMGIYVKTNKTETYYGYSFDLDSGKLGKESSAKITGASDITGSAYVNPYANFMGTVIRDENDTITGIMFVQA
jgi:hypothetical protein